MSKLIVKPKQNRITVRLTESRELPPGAIGHITIWVPRDPETGNLTSVNNRQWDWDSVVKAIGATNEYIQRNGNISRYLGHPEDGDPVLLGYKPCLTIYKLDIPKEQNGFYFHAWLLDCQDGLAIKERLAASQSVAASIVGYLDCQGIGGTGVCGLPDGALLAVDLLKEDEDPGIPGSRIVGFEKKCCSQCAIGHPCCANKNKSEVKMSKPPVKGNTGMPTKAAPKKTRAEIKAALQKAKTKHQEAIDDAQDPAAVTAAAVDALDTIAAAVADAEPADVAAAILTGGMDMEMPSIDMPPEDDAMMVEEDPAKMIEGENPDEMMAEGDDPMIEADMPPEDDAMMVEEDPAKMIEGASAMKKEGAAPANKNTKKPTQQPAKLKPTQQTPPPVASFEAALKAAVDNHPAVIEIQKERKLAAKQERLRSLLTGFATEKGDLKNHKEIATTVIGELTNDYVKYDLTKVSHGQLKTHYSVEMEKRKPKAVARATESANTQPGLTVFAKESGISIQTDGDMNSVRRGIALMTEMSVQGKSPETRDKFAKMKQINGLTDRILTDVAKAAINSYGPHRFMRLGSLLSKSTTLRMEALNSGLKDAALLDRRFVAERNPIIAANKQFLATESADVIGQDARVPFEALIAAGLVEAYHTSPLPLLTTPEPSTDRGGLYPSGYDPNISAQLYRFYTERRTNNPDSFDILTLHEGIDSPDSVLIEENPWTYAAFMDSDMVHQDLFAGHWRGQAPFGSDIQVRNVENLMDQIMYKQHVKAYSKLINDILARNAVQKTSEVVQNTPAGGSSTGHFVIGNLFHGIQYGANVAACIWMRRQNPPATPVGSINFGPVLQPEWDYTPNVFSLTVKFPIILTIAGNPVNVGTLSPKTGLIERRTKKQPDLATNPYVAFDPDRGVAVLNATAATGLAASIAAGTTIFQSYHYGTNVSFIEGWNSSLSEDENNTKFLFDLLAVHAKTSELIEGGRRPGVFTMRLSQAERLIRTPALAATGAGQLESLRTSPAWINARPQEPQEYASIADMMIAKFRQFDILGVRAPRWTGQALPSPLVVLSNQYNQVFKWSLMPQIRPNIPGYQMLGTDVVPTNTEQTIAQYAVLSQRIVARDKNGAPLNDADTIIYMNNVRP